MSGGRDNEAAGNIGHDFERGAELAHDCEVAGRDRSYLGVKIVSFAREISRLGTAADPPSGRGAMEYQGAAYPAVIIAPAKKRVDLRRARVRAFETQLDRATNFGCEALTPKRMAQRSSFAVLDFAIVLRPPRKEFGSFVGAVDFVARELC
jgi:hypothetical protein